MMRKLSALLLAAIMAASLLTGCGSGGTSSATSSSAASISASSSASSSSSAVPENTVTGDPAASNAFVVWGWNTDFDNIKYVLDQEYPDLSKRIVFVNAGGPDYYQDKIDAILQDPSNPLYPDLMLLEVGYVQKYVKSDYLMDVADLGITSNDMKDMSIVFDCGSLPGDLSWRL